MAAKRARTEACFLLSVMALALLIPAPRGLTAQSQGRRDVVVEPDDDPVKSLPREERRFALVIGVDEYQDEGRIKKLDGAVNDAKAIAETLKQYAGFPDRNVFLLTSDARVSHLPTRNNILTYLKALAGLVTKDGQNGLLLVYFAGHGKAPSSEPYLLPLDMNIPDYSNTAISATEIKQIIQQKQVEQVILIIDACRRDPFTDRSGEDSSLTDAYKGFSFGAANRDIKAFATLYATGLHQYAYEFDADGKKRGYFSYSLEKGLKGAAANE